MCVLSVMLGDFYLKICKRLESAGVENPGLDARILVCFYAGIDDAEFIARPEAVLSGDCIRLVERAVESRISGEPVSKIIQRREFYGLDFRVTKDTLDPRPDTETLVDAVLEWVKSAGRAGGSLQILDLGTGTGCIAISLLHHLENARATAVDISPQAIEVAQTNATLNNVQDRITFVESNWFSNIRGERFDIIVSNPPYIPNPDIPNLQKEVKNHDPILSLQGGKDGLDAYRTIVTETKSALKKGGKIFLEIGFGQLGDVVRLVKDSGFQNISTHVDMSGIARVVEISSGDK